MLKERLFLFFSSLKSKNLSTEQQQRLFRAILLYCLGRRNAAEFRAMGRKFGITDELYEFKYKFLDRSYWVISIFWRVAFKYFQELEVPTADGPADTIINQKLLRAVAEKIPSIPSDKRRACLDDMRLLETLSLDDHRRLFVLSRASRFETPTDMDLVPVIKQLRKFCYWLAVSKMRFLAKYDASLSVEDMGEELFEAALVTLRNYDSDYLDTRKVYNFSKAGAEHHCIRLIQYHTTKCRGRIIQVKTNEGVEFSSTTISMDQPLENDSSITISDVLCDEAKDQDTQLSDHQWLCRLLSRTPQEVARVVQIVLGQPDPEFSAWLAAQGTEIGHLSDTVLARKACQFVNIPLRKVKTALQRTHCMQLAS